MKNSYLRYFLLACIFSLFISACAIQRSAVTGDKRAYGFSWAKAQKMGAKASKQVIATYGLYKHEHIQEYVRDVAHRVLKHSDLRDKNTPKIYLNTKYHYYVLDNPVINAFALPGGYIFVDRGLLTHLENEAQLAMILAHETGHEAARHMAQQAFNRMLGKLALFGSAIAGQAILGVPAVRILKLGSLATRFLFLKYTREDEKEADALGVKYSSKAGYKASEAAGFFHALERISGGRGNVPDWTQTHPDPGDRIQAILKEAQKLDKKGYDKNMVYEKRYMQKIDNMIYGHNPRHGFTRNGVFYHPGLAFKFSYPNNWKVHNLSSIIQIINPGQNAIILMQIDSKNNSPRASVAEFLNQKGINVINSGNTSFHGLNGYQATATGHTKKGAKVDFYLYSVAYNGNIYRFVCYTFAQKYDLYQPAFFQTTRSFSRLTDNSILNIQPARLHVFRAPRTAPFKSFLPENLPLDITPQEVAIANQVQLNETIQEGEWIKIPEQ